MSDTCQHQGCNETIRPGLTHPLCDEHLNDYTITLLEDIRDTLTRLAPTAGEETRWHD